MSKINVSKIWNEIIRDMEGDDIVLEIRVDNVDLAKQNDLLKFLMYKNYNVKYFYAGEEMSLPLKVDEEIFISDESKEVVIDFLTCKLYYYFNAIDEMEFYTDSVIRLNNKEAYPLFEFIHQVGSFICSKIHLYIESYPKHSYVFDPLPPTRCSMK